MNLDECKHLFEDDFKILNNDETQYLLYKNNNCLKNPIYSKTKIDENIQIIASNITAELKTYMDKHNIILNFKVHSVKLPIDPRLKRIAITTSINGRSEHVMDIFNPNDHTLVPYIVMNNIKIVIITI